MGYFSNGTEGEMYEAHYCSRCKHGEWVRDDTGRVPLCAVWEAHMMHNYEECNKEDSILHVLIPRIGVRNEQCRMFLPTDAPT